MSPDAVPFLQQLCYRTTGPLARAWARSLVDGKRQEADNTPGFGQVAPGLLCVSVPLW